MTEDTCRKIKARYWQGLTATESWRFFLDGHATWFTLTTITKPCITFAGIPGQPSHDSAC